MSKLPEDVANGTSVRFLRCRCECATDTFFSVAYFTQESLEYLHTIDDVPGLSSLHVPPGKYKSARSAKNGRSSNPGYDPLSTNLYTGNQYGPYPRRQIHTTPTYYNPAAIDPNRHNTSPRSNPIPQHQRTTIPDRPKPRSAPGKGDLLAPLAYLENIPPPRRHPLDEEALMSFTGVPV